MTLADNVRRLRNARVLSQAELALRAGVAKGTVTRIEGGGYVPHPRTIRQLAEALSVEPGDLVTPEELEKKGVA